MPTPETRMRETECLEGLEGSEGSQLAAGNRASEGGRLGGYRLAMAVCAFKSAGETAV